MYAGSSLSPLMLAESESIDVAAGRAREDREACRRRSARRDLGPCVRREGRRSDHTGDRDLGVGNKLMAEGKKKEFIADAKHLSRHVRPVSCAILTHISKFSGGSYL